MEESENISQKNQIQNNDNQNPLINDTVSSYNNNQYNIEIENISNNKPNELSFSSIKKEIDENQLINTNNTNYTNISTSYNSNKDNDIQIEEDKSKNTKKYAANNYSISPPQKNKRNLNNNINFNKIGKPFFTYKHILLNKYSLKEVNECIYKDYKQLENILPYYQNYYFHNKIDNYRNNNYNINNNNDVILICLKYIECTNFFFNNDITYKVQNLIFNIIKDDRQILEQNKYSFLKNKLNEVYQKLIPFNLKFNYLKSFYDRNPDKNLYYFFKRDLNKINLSKHIDKRTVNFLYDIFEIVKQKMDMKKESIKISLNELLNYNNINNSNINKNNNNYNSNIQNIKKSINDLNINNHYNSSFNSRKSSFQYSSSQNNNISNNKINYKNQNNRKDNDMNYQEVSQFTINNYNRDNNFKQNHLNRHNYFYKNSNHKSNNNERERDYLKNKNNNFYKRELVEIEDVDNKELIDTNIDDINEDEYKNLILKIDDDNNVNANEQITEKKNNNIIINDISEEHNNDNINLNNDKENSSENDNENDNIHIIKINEEEDKNISSNININKDTKEECDEKIKDNYSQENDDINNLKSYNFLYDLNNNDNNENDIKKTNSYNALPRITFNDINSTSNDMNHNNNNNHNSKNIINKNNNKNNNDGVDNINYKSIGFNNSEISQLLKLMVSNQNNIMEKLNKYIFLINQMNSINNNNNNNKQNMLYNNNFYGLNIFNLGIKNNLNYNLNSYNQYNNKNYNFHSFNKQEKIIESEYIKLKKKEKENPEEIKKNLQLFENHILLQIYNDINTNNNNSKTISLYPKIFSKYEKAINSILEKYNLTDVIVEPYGSVVNNFLTKDGDIDISIIPKSISKDDFIKYLQKIEEKLVIEDKCAIQYSNIYINSRYALLSLVDIETNINIDIAVHNLLPIYNTKMIRLYSLYDQRFHILGLFLKHWVKINNIKGAPNGFLSSYALLLLIIHFLQSVVEPKVLPILQEIKNINKEYKYYNGEKELTTNLYFEENIDDIKEYMNIINCGNENNMTNTELLVQFFEYYAYKYNMENHYLISIKHSNKIKAKNCEQIVFPIEDPFDVAHNPGKTMKYNSQQHSEFIFCMKKEINNILSGEYFKNYNY